MKLLYPNNKIYSAKCINCEFFYMKLGNLDTKCSKKNQSRIPTAHTCRFFKLGDVFKKRGIKIVRNDRKMV